MRTNEYIYGFNNLTRFLEELGNKYNLSREEIHIMLTEKIYDMAMTNEFFKNSEFNKRR